MGIALLRRRERVFRLACGRRRSVTRGVCDGCTQVDSATMLNRTFGRRILPTHQRIAAAYQTVRLDSSLRVTINYEDEAGCHWRRTDFGKPRPIVN